MRSPLGVILLLVWVALIAKSPKKMRTLGRMVTAFLLTAFLLLVPNALLRMGDPRAWGRISGIIALLVAAIAGWWHVRSVLRAQPDSSGRSQLKP